MSVLAKSSSEPRSANSGLGGSSPFLGFFGLAPSFLALSGWSWAGLAGSKNPAGLGSETTLRRLRTASPAVVKPAASVARGSVESPAATLFIRSISAFWSVVTSLVKRNITGS